MKKIILTYGLISGGIVALLMLITWPLHDNGTLDMANAMILGYSTMIISLSLIFFGVRNYRDNYSNGAVTFGRAFLIGLGISGVAAVMYALAWEVCYHTLASGFMEEMSQHAMEEMQANGVTGDALAAKQQEMNEFAEMYKNPVFRFGMTMCEILPVGLIVALITAAILRKKKMAG